MKFCIDCRFYAHSDCFREQIVDVEQMTKEAKASEVSPVDGSVITFKSFKPTFTAMSYRKTGSCGMEAKFFEPKK